MYIMYYYCYYHTYILYIMIYYVYYCMSLYPLHPLVQLCKPHSAIIFHPGAIDFKYQQKIRSNTITIYYIYYLPPWRSCIGV